MARPSPASSFRSEKENERKKKQVASGGVGTVKKGRKRLGARDDTLAKNARQDLKKEKRAAVPAAAAPVARPPAAVVTPDAPETAGKRRSPAARAKPAKYTVDVMPAAAVKKRAAAVGAAKPAAAAKRRAASVIAAAQPTKRAAPRAASVIRAASAKPKRAASAVAATPANPAAARRAAAAKPAASTAKRASSVALAGVVQKRGRAAMTPAPPRPSHSKNPSIYNMMLPPKIVKLEQLIDVQVETNLHLTPDEEYELVLQMISEDSATMDWPIDYIVASMHKTLRKLIMKYTGLATPCVLELAPREKYPTTKEFQDFAKRMAALEMVAAQLKKEMGAAAFKEHYPYFYAEDEDGVTESQFCTNSRSIYLGRLAAFEWRITHEADKHHLPPVWFVNWTDRRDIPDFEYTTKLEPSATVRAVLQRTNELAGVGCRVGECKSLGGGASCESTLTATKQHRGCECRVFRKGKRTRDADPVECTDACDCDPERCGNRVIQRGRQIPMLVFYDYEKGWTCRALTDIAQGDFVGEYVGEVMTAYEIASHADHTYTAGMPPVRKLKKPTRAGKDTYSALVIDAAKKGNETRFVSHSCAPNLGLIYAYVEKHGGWFTRDVFVADRPIAAGEELTFDYFLMMSAPTGGAKPKANDLFQTCLCKTDQCKFKGVTREMFEDAQEASRKERRDALAVEDSWDEDEEEQEKRRKIRQEEKKKRLEMRVITEQKRAAAASKKNPVKSEMMTRQRAKKENEQNVGGAKIELRGRAIEVE